LENITAEIAAEEATVGLRGEGDDAGHTGGIISLGYSQNLDEGKKRPFPESWLSMTSTQRKKFRRLQNRKTKEKEA